MNPARKERAGAGPWLTWLIYTILLVVGIPWYWPAETVTLVWGIPLWALVSMGASLVTSAYTAWLLLYRWPEPSEDDMG